MKRVLCIISSLNTGGAETFLMKIYRMLDKSKYQIDFCVSMKQKGYYDDEVLANGGRIFYVTPKSVNLKSYRTELTALISKEKYERVLRVASNGMGFLDLAIAKKAGAKKCIVRSSNSSDGKSLKARVAHVIGKFLYMRYIDVMIAPSDLAGKYTFGSRNYNGGNVHILHNGLDLDVYKYSEDARRALREEFGLDNKFVVGHVGRFSNQKNHMFLLSVFAEIKSKRSDAKLLLVGKGELENSIREQAASLGILDDIVFAGVRSDVPSLLSAMDVFVFPSFYEGMPNTVIEAQATGLPCVISDTITKTADITGLVKYLSLTFDSQLWAETALSCVSDVRLNTKQAFIDTHYDIETVGKEFIELVF